MVVFSDSDMEKGLFDASCNYNGVETSTNQNTPQLVLKGMPAFKHSFNERSPVCISRCIVNDTKLSGFC